MGNGKPRMGLSEPSSLVGKSKDQGTSEPGDQEGFISVTSTDLTISVSSAPHH